MYSWYCEYTTGISYSNRPRRAGARAAAPWRVGRAHGRARGKAHEKADHGPPYAKFMSEVFNRRIMV